MSQEIDEKVVEMRFDNKQFEREAATTMTTLQKLKEHLNFSKVGDSFDAIDKASKKVDMSGIGNAVQTVQAKFSALEVMAITALSNITNQALNAGKKLLAAFTIDPIKTGFQEYETQMGAVQTILANTSKEGTTLGQVNKALDELNTYADKTIYNFTEMTKNIGTFTAAGLNLDTSVKAIQGIANLAAVSGSTSQQASTAMYQLSQALSAGTVRLMDWNSVVNAGMGGKVFQDAIMETAEAMGEVDQALINAYKSGSSFRELLNPKDYGNWFTSDLLAETLKKFTETGAVEYLSKYANVTQETIRSVQKLGQEVGFDSERVKELAMSITGNNEAMANSVVETLKMADTATKAATQVKTFSQLMDTMKEAVQSGWAQTWRIMIGDFDQAKKLFTEISNTFDAMISASADSRNSMLTSAFGSGFSQLVAKGIDDAESFRITIQTVADTYGTNFSKMVEDTGDFDEALRQALQSGDMTAGMLTESVHALTESWKGMTVEEREASGITFEMLEHIEELDKGLQDGSISMEEFANKMGKLSGRELVIDSVRNAFNYLLDVIRPVSEAYHEAFDVDPEGLYNLIDKIHEFTKKMKLSEESSKNLKDAFKGVFDIIKLVGSGFKGLLGLILPINKPIGAVSKGLLGMAGGAGRALSAFSGWVRGSSKIAKAYDTVSKAIHKAMTWIGDLIGGIDDFAREVVGMEETQKILNAIVRAFEAAGKAGKEHMQVLLGKIKEFKDKIGDVVPDKAKKAFETLSQSFSEFSDDLDKIDFSKSTEWFGKLKDAIEKFMTSITGNSGLMTFIDNSKSYGEKMGEAFSFDKAVENIEKAKETIGGFVDWMKEHVAPLFEDFSIGGVLAGGAGIGIVYSFIKMAKGFENISNIFGSVPEMLDSVRGAISAYQRDLNATAILKTAAAIGILAAALVLLSFTDTNQLLKAALALSMIGTVLFIGIGILSNALNKGKSMTDVMNTFAKSLGTSMKNLSKAAKYKAIGEMIKDLSNAIIKVALSIIAIGLLYQKNPEAIKSGGTIVGIIAGALVGIVTVMSLLGNKISQGMKSFAMAAIGMGVLAFSLSAVIKSLILLFATDLPPDWKKKLEIVALLLAEMAGLTVVIGLANRIAGSGGMKAGPIIATVLGVAGLVFVLTQLFKVELPSDYKRKMDIMEGMFIALGSLILVIGVASRLAGGKIKATGTILAMCFFIATATAALLVLSVIPWDNLKKGAIALGGILIALAASLAAAGKITDPSAAKAVTAMAVAVGVITASLAILSLIPVNKLLPSAIILGVMLGVLAVDFNYISKITNAKAWMTVLAMVGAVAMIAAALIDMSKHMGSIGGMLASALALSSTLIAYAQALKIVSATRGIKLEKIGLFLLATLALVPIGVVLGVLSHQPWEGLLASGIALSGVLLAFAQTMKMISAMRGIKVAKIGEFLLATLALVPIGAALYILASQPWAGMLAAGVAISAVVMAIAGAMSLMSAFKPNLGAIVAFAVGVVGVLGIAASLYFLSTQPVDSILAAAVAIGAVLLAMSAAMLVAVAVGAAAGPALIGLGVLALFIAAFTGILVALGAIFQNPDAQQFLNGGAEILAQIGYALGDFVGSIVGGFLGGVSSGLPAIGENMSGFMEAAKPFFDGAKDISPEAMRGVKYLAEAILLLTGASILDGLTSWLTGGSSIVGFGQQLAEFGPYFKQYADSVAGIDAAVVESSANAALVLADMASKLPNSGGLAGKIFGENNLSDFARELAVFGPIIKQYGEDVAGLDAAAIEASANAAQILSDMASDLPNSGGLAGKIFGENNLSDFGKELAKFGPIIKQYSLDVQGLDGEAVEASARAAQIMSDMANDLPNAGGLAAKILGDNTLSSFGEELVKFGPLIAEYASSIAGLDAAVITNSANAAGALVTLANQLPNSGGLVSWFTGDNDIGSFGESLVTFGNSMSTYYNSVSGINTTQLNGVIVEFKNLVDLANTVTGVDTSGMTGFVAALGEMGTTGVNQFIAAFTNSYSTVTTTVNTFVNQATNALQLKNSIFTQKGTAAVNAYLTAIRNQYPTATTVGTTLGNNVLNALGLLMGTFTTKGTSAANNFLMGIRNKYPEATSTGTTLANNALAGLQACYDNFKIAGSNAGQGFVDGIKDWIDEASSAGRDIANAAYNAAKSALDEHSPSKKMGQVGSFAGLGFVNKLMLYVEKAYKVGQQLGNAAVDGVNKAVSDVSEIFTSDLAGDPVIKPRVDMSEVTKSADDVSRLFNDAIAMTAGRAGSVSGSFVNSHKFNGADLQNGEGSQKPVVINNNDFTQNNYSPKSLSRIEIYRQTNNQFSRFAEAVNKV